MESFENKNLIVSIYKDVYQIDSVEELIEILMGEEYIGLSEEDKFSKRYELILPMSIENNKLIVDSSAGVIDRNKETNNTIKYKIEDSLFIDDDILFILSLCKLNQIHVLEKIDADIFASKIDKSKMEGNYIIINTFVDKLIEEYIK